MLTKTALPFRSRIRKQLVSLETDLKRLTIRSILVPLDFSPASFSALDLVLGMAERFQASVHLVHTFGFDYSSSTLAAMPMIGTESKLAKVRNAV